MVCRGMFRRGEARNCLSHFSTGGRGLDRAMCGIAGQVEVCYGVVVSDALGSGMARYGKVWQGLELLLHSVKRWRGMDGARRGKARKGEVRLCTVRQGKLWSGMNWRRQKPPPYFFISIELQTLSVLTSFAHLL